MYRVSRVLNNNGVIAIDMEDNQEYVLLGKGLGFGKKVSERFEKPDETSMYRLADDTERGSAKSLARNVAPEFIEMADAVMREAKAASAPWIAGSCCHWPIICPSQPPGSGTANRSAIL